MTIRSFSIQENTSHIVVYQNREITKRPTPPSWNLVIGLVRPAPCPGTEAYGDCTFPQTPFDHPNDEMHIAWSCPAGYFCVSPDKIDACTPGFYCPENTAQPIYCPGKYYCEQNAAQLWRCPKGFICPTATTNPLQCTLGSCAPGTEFIIRYFSLLGFLIYLIVAAVFIQLRAWLQRRRTRAAWTKVMDQPAGQGVSCTMMHHSEGDIECAADSPESYIEFHGMEFELSDGRKILNSVSGCFRSGRMCAVMGPSGSGKTTLLATLMGKHRRAKGKVVFNGKEKPLSYFKHLIGFVPQDDIMLPEFTVYETLMHAAQMRLPRSRSWTQIQEHVLGVIESLGLKQIKDCILGDIEHRGISGGQRKRVNIGVELVCHPKILLLDEPTTGLDTSTAKSICEALHQIAKRDNIIVVSIIHAPNPSTLLQFDDVLILTTGGSIVYHGSLDMLSDYLKSNEITPPSDESCMDFILDLLSRSGRRSKDDINLVDMWRKKRELYYVPDGYPASSPSSVSDRSRTLECSSHSKTQTFIGRNVVDALWWWLGDIGSEWLHYVWRRFRSPTEQSRISHFTMLYLLLLRSLKQVYRRKSTFLSEPLLHFGCGLFISMAIKNFNFLDRQPETICAMSPALLQTSCREGVDFVREAGIFVCLGIMFAGISASTITFGAERLVYFRETARGMPTLPYYMGKVVSDIPRALLASLSFTMGLVVFFVYYSSFLFHFGLVFLLYFVAYAVGYFLSTFMRREMVALAGAGVGLASTLVFSGVMPSLDTVAEAYPRFSWIWDTSAPRWAIEAFWIREVQARSFRHLTARHGYRWEDLNFSLWMIFSIGIVWHVFAFSALKLCFRQHQR